MANGTQTQDSAENYGYKQELNRSLGFRHLVVFGLVVMLPIAPTQVYTFASTESGGMAPLVYLIGIIAMVFTALSYQKLSREFAIAGSGYSYVQRGLNHYAGFITGWLLIMDYLLIPGLLIAFSNLWLSVLFPKAPTLLIIIAFAVIISTINILGTKVFKHANNIFLGAQIGLIIIFLITAIKYVFIDGRGLGGFSLAPFYQPGKIDLHFIASAASIAMLGFLGFDSISTLSEETKNPKKTVGKAIVSSLLIIGFLFLAQAYMATLAHPDYTNLDPDMGYFDIIREVGGDYLYYAFIGLGVLAVGVANAETVQAAISRIIFSMARDKMVPGAVVLSKVNKKYKTPMNAIIFTGVVAVILAKFVPLEVLVSLVNFGALSTFVLVNFTAFYHSFVVKKQRSAKDIFRSAIAPLIGVIVVGFVWTGFTSFTFIVGFSWIFLGIIFLAYKTKGFKQLPPALKLDDKEITHEITK